MTYSNRYFDTVKTHRADLQVPDLIPVPRALVYDKRLSPISCIVYGELLDSARGAVVHGVSRRDLAARLNLRVQVISVSINRLKAAGYLSITFHDGRIPSSYSLLNLSKVIEAKS